MNFGDGGGGVDGKLEGRSGRGFAVLNRVEEGLCVRERALGTDGGEEGWLTSGRRRWRRRWSCSWRFVGVGAGGGGAEGGAGGEGGRRLV